MTTETYTIKTVEELGSVAMAWHKKFPIPSVFTLLGEMGAGKTTFVKKICEVLGADITSSPTFSLVNEYRGRNDVLIYHFDLYRVESMAEALDFGFEEYLEENAYIFIEWPDKVLPILPAHHTIQIVDTGDARKIVF